MYDVLQTKSNIIANVEVTSDMLSEEFPILSDCLNLWCNDVMTQYVDKRSCYRTDIWGKFGSRFWFMNINMIG